MARPFVRIHKPPSLPFPILRALPIRPYYIITAPTTHYHQYHLESTAIAIHPLPSLSSPPPRLFDYLSIEFSPWRDRTQ